MLGIGGPVGMFGSVPFVCAQGQVLTFSKLSREQKSRWAQHEVIGAKPRLEWVGDELSTVTLTIRLDTNLGVAPLAGLLYLKRILRRHQPQRLIIGPDYMGKFVLESFSEEQKFHSGAGVCLIADVTLNLTEYVE